MPQMIEIPDKAEKCQIYIRHSKSVQEGSGIARSLTLDGIKLARRIGPVYATLVGSLSHTFGNPVFVRSKYVRAILTLWEIFHPELMFPDPRIGKEVSLKEIDRGRWYVQQKESGANVNQMLCAVHQDLSLLDGQPYGERMDEVHKFFSAEDEHTTNLVVGCGHEPEPTLWVLKNGWLPKGNVGLNECESYISFIDGSGQIIQVIKFCPLDHLPKRAA